MLCVSQLRPQAMLWRGEGGGRSKVIVFSMQSEGKPLPEPGPSDPEPAVWFCHVVFHNIATRPTKLEAAGLQTSYNKDVWCNHGSPAETAPMAVPDLTQQSRSLFKSHHPEIQVLLLVFDCCSFGFMQNHSTLAIFTIFKRNIFTNSVNADGNTS